MYLKYYIYFMLHYRYIYIFMFLIEMHYNCTFSTKLVYLKSAKLEQLILYLKG